MNIYIYRICIRHSIMVEEKQENDNLWTFFNHLETGPFNRPDPHKIKIMKEILSSIPSHPVTSNWWRDFSTWEDFEGLLHSGTKLSMHDVVSRINENLKLIQNSSSNIEWIDENGNIQINLDEISRTLLQGFTITARRRKLRRLKDISAYIVAGQISGKSDIKNLQLPISLNRLVASFLDTYSRDL